VLTLYYCPVGIGHLRYHFLIIVEHKLVSVITVYVDMNPVFW